MSKVTKKTKNPLLEEDEVIQEEVLEETVEEEVEEAPVAKKSSAKKVAVKVNVEEDAKNDISATKKALDADEEVAFMIPLSEGEKPGAVHTVQINGFKYDVPKGVMTTVPRKVSNLLADYYKIGQQAGSDFRVDLNEAKQNALRG